MKRNNTATAAVYAAMGFALAHAIPARAQTAPAAPSPTPSPVPAVPATASEDEDTIVLSPFVVDAEQDRGYQASATLAGTRLRTDLADVGSAISVLTKEFITDVGGYNNQGVLAYAVNTEVAGPRGNFSGANRNGAEGHVVEPGNLSNPNGSNRVRGLSAADNTRDFFLSDIPWDGYNISRVDIQRGPNAILFGLGSPAGIINAATNTATFKNTGSVQFITDKWGSYRGSIDINRRLIANQLGVRVALLDNHQKFQQKPAFAHDRRGYGALRYAPDVLNRDGMKFEISANIEHGEINSNFPRSIPPEDQITPFWKPLAVGGLNGRVFDTRIAPIGSNRPQDTFAGNEPAVAYSAVTYSNFGPGMALYANANGAPLFLSGNPALYLSRDDKGNVIMTTESGAGSGPAKGYGGGATQGRVIATPRQWATALGGNKLPFANVGAYNNETLTDTSVFDFYNKLIDGNNKGESRKWNAYTVDLQNNFFNNLVGYNISMYRELTRTSNWSALNWEGNTIRMEINANLPNGQDNPNVGRPYAYARSNGGANTETIARRAYRGQAYLDYDFEKRHKGLLGDILGDQRLSGVLSDEGAKRDSRNYDLIDFDMNERALFAPNPRRTGTGTGGGVDQWFYYLGDDIRGKVNAKGANLNSIGNSIWNQGGGLVPITYFDRTWIAPASVDASAPWINPRDPNGIINKTYVQANNPDNYKGWTTTNANLVTYGSNAIVPGTSVSANDYLTNSATLVEDRVRSEIGVYQGTFWHHSIVGVYGIRYDRARKYNYNTSFSNQAKNVDPLTGSANVNPSTYNFSNPTAYQQTIKAHTKNWSIMGHINKLVPGFDPLPVNIRLYYNKGENFQPLAGRRDFLGQLLSAPGGTTTDKTVMVSTKDNKYSLRLTKFESALTEATSTDAQNANLWAIGQTLGFGGNSYNAAPPGIARGYLLGLFTPESTGYTTRKDVNGNFGDANKLMNVYIPAWMNFEKELRQKFPGFVEAWLGKNTTFGTGVITGDVPNATAPTGAVVTEDSVSTGYELEFTANPTKNWRIAVNGSQTRAVRSNVMGKGFAEVAAFVDNAYMNTDVGLMPIWSTSQVNGIRGAGPYVGFFRSEYLRVLALDKQSAPEIRKYRGNLITSYDFDEGALKGWGVGGAMRYESSATLAYAPIKKADGTYGVNLNAPFKGPAERTYDLWLSYRRKLTDKIDWRIQLNVFNVGGKNKLVPISAGVDAEKMLAIDKTTIGPDTKVPMKATGFSIKEGMSWQLTNTLEF